MMAEKQQMEQVLKAHFTKYTGLSLYNYDLKKLAELECAIRELRESRPKSAATSSCINCLGCGTSSRTAVAQLEMALSAWDKYTIAVKEERLKTLFHLFKEDFATKKVCWEGGGVKTAKIKPEVVFFWNFDISDKSSVTLFSDLFRPKVYKSKL